jgi:hypothetical protein
MERRIGVAISGGGYRAAAWGLGSLLYLSDAGLHQAVVTASSVSGGSITNAGLGLKPFKQMNPEDLWEYSAHLAPRLAGNVKAFLAVLLVHVVVWGTAVVGAATHEPVLAAGALILSVLLSLLLAPICADATFASRLMWLYLDILAASLALFAFSVGEGWWWLAALVLVAVFLQFRGVVVGWAIGKSVLRAAGGRTRLSDLSGPVLVVQVPRASSSPTSKVTPFIRTWCRGRSRSWSRGPDFRRFVCMTFGTAMRRWRSRRGCT